MSKLDWRKSSFSNPEHACVEVAWHKSSRSNGNGMCVEVALGQATGVRDSKNPGGGVLLFKPTAWQAFRSVITQP